MSPRTSAAEILDSVLDGGSFVSWDSTPVDVHPGESYLKDLAKAREKSGVDESVLTGEGTIDGRRVAIIACEFAFLAGSIGVAAAERITSAIERATAEGLPLIASPTSGGTRMQEGTLAFVQMVKIASAVTAHKAAHLPYVVYLRAIRRREAFSHPGVHWPTSPSPNPRPSSGSSARGCIRPCTTSHFPMASRPPRICTSTVSSTVWCRSSNCVTC